MSSDNDDPFADFHRDVQASAEKPIHAAGRSAADDIIDVVGDLNKNKKPGRPCCPACRSFEFTTTRPLGAAPRNRCSACGHKWLGAPRSPASLVLAKIGSPQTATSGPYYRGSAIRPDVDKNSPKSRLKAKSRGAFKEKK